MSTPDKVISFVLFLIVVTVGFLCVVLFGELSALRAEQQQLSSATNQEIAALVDRVSTLEQELTPSTDNLSITYGQVTQTRWSAFAEGERILLVEVDIKNNGNAAQPINAADFVVRDSASIPIPSVHQSRVAEQPRFVNGIPLETNRIEIREVTVPPRGEIKGVLAYFVSGNPETAYLVEFNGQSNLLPVRE